MESEPTITCPLTDDDVDEILYLSRENEENDLREYLHEIRRRGDSPSDPCTLELVLAAHDEHSGNGALHFASANGHIGGLPV